MNFHCLFLLLPLLGVWGGLTPPPHGWKVGVDDRVDMGISKSEVEADDDTTLDSVPLAGWSVELDQPVDRAGGRGSGLSSPSSAGLHSFLDSADRKQGKRIIYGDQARYGSHPYICSLQLRQWGFWFHICGAVLYNQATLLTAAHCVHYYAPSRLRVRCGEHNLQGTDAYEVTRRLETIIKHPDYAEDSSRGFPNDLALLKTKGPVDLEASPYVQAFPIDDGTNASLPVSCTLSGWGRTETGILPSILEDVQIDRLTNAECATRWGSRLINDGHVCFKNPYSATSYEASCSGDSGGPANCGGVIVGVTSWGIANCVTRYYPSVYTRLAYYYNWIVNNAFY